MFESAYRLGFLGSTTGTGFGASTFGTSFFGIFRIDFGFYTGGAGVIRLTYPSGIFFLQHELQAILAQQAPPQHFPHDGRLQQFEQFGRLQQFPQLGRLQHVPQFGKEQQFPQLGRLQQDPQSGKLQQFGMLHQLVHDGNDQHAKLGKHDAVQHDVQQLGFLAYSYASGSTALLNLRDKFASALEFRSLNLLLSLVSLQQFEIPPILIYLKFIKRYYLYKKAQKYIYLCF